MAKTKKPKDRPEAPVYKSGSMTIRASAEWRAWLDRAADHCRVNVSTLLDMATAKYAKDQGFTAPPPKR